MNIVSTLRIKNEEKCILRCLESISQISSHILIFDDHSNDSTEIICKKFRDDKFKNLHYYKSPFDETTDEVRDKNKLLEITLKYATENTWVLAIDGDEELEKKSQDKLPELLNKLSKFKPDPLVFVQFLYLWDRTDQYRADGIYGKFFQPRIWRVPKDRSDLKFVKNTAKMGFHCGSVPYMLPIIPYRNTAIKFLHYGYLEEETRIMKYIYYNLSDPSNTYEDFYRHIINTTGGCKYTPEPIELKDIK